MVSIINYRATKLLSELIVVWLPLQSNSQRNSVTRFDFEKCLICANNAYNTVLDIFAPQTASPLYVIVLTVTLGQASKQFR